MTFIIIFGILAIFCFGYFAFAASYAGLASSFLWFWPMAGIGFSIFALLIYIGKKRQWLVKMPRWLLVFFAVCVCIGVILFSALETCVILGMNYHPKENADYVIVLGAQVRGTRVTKSLKKRLDAAYDYAVKYPKCKVIVSGGQGPGEDIAEAEAMRIYLLEKGLEEERILVEDKSTTTKENLLYSKDIIQDETAEVVIVTNNFHAFRALKLAGKLDYQQVSILPASSDNRLLLNYMVREAAALIKEKLLGNI